MIATLLQLKREVESQTKKTLKLTLVGAAEAHLLAEEIGDAGVGVILLPARSYPYTWEQKRMCVSLSVQSLVLVHGHADTNLNTQSSGSTLE